MNESLLPLTANTIKQNKKLSLARQILEQKECLKRFEVDYNVKSGSVVLVATIEVFNIPSFLRMEEEVAVRWKEARI